MVWGLGMRKWLHLFRLKNEGREWIITSKENYVTQKKKDMEDMNLTMKIMTVHVQKLRKKIEIR